jgi:hypothetical protein
MRDCPGSEREKQAEEEGIPRWRGFSSATGELRRTPRGAEVRCDGSAPPGHDDPSPEWQRGRLRLWERAG